jgi:DNA-binding NarL/FixJ family response regulator
MHTLIIDDSRTMRRLERAVVDALALGPVAEAPDAEEGLSRARLLRPGLILVDQHLPGMSGLDFIAAARADGLDAKIILVSTQSDLPARRAAVDAGADATLPKPFTPDLLSQRIDEVLAVRAAA